MEHGAIIGIDPSNLTDKSVNALLLAYLLEHPDQTYFAAGAKNVYLLGGKRFTLQKPLLRRNKIIEGLPGPIVKYDVLGGCLGKGANGEVFELDNTLTLTKTKILTKTDKKHVVKITYDYLDLVEFLEHKIYFQKTEKSQIYHEREQLLKGPRFRPKALTIQAMDANVKRMFLTTRKFTGESLKTIIRGNDLTAEQRLRLTIALLRALKEQIHDLGIIHRDIKPDNIIVNLATMEVNIIDLGLSTSISRPSIVSCGTPGFISPEVMKYRKPTPKSDVFSMSRVLARLWGDNHDCWRWRSNELIYATSEHRFDLRQLFQNPAGKFADLNGKEILKESIKSAIASMDKKSERHRESVEGAVARFHSNYLMLKYPNLGDEQRLILKKAFNEGQNLRVKLVQSKDANVFSQSFASTLEEFSDVNSVREFLHGLGWSSLSVDNPSQELEGTDLDADVQNIKAKLIAKSKNIIDEYRGNIKKYLYLLQCAEVQLCKYLIMKTSVLNELKGFIHELDNKLGRIIARPFDIDLLQQANKDIDNNYRYWEEKLATIFEDIEKDERYVIIKETVERVQPALGLEDSSHTSEASHLDGKLQELVRLGEILPQDNFKKKADAEQQDELEHLVDDKRMGVKTQDIEAALESLNKLKEALRNAMRLYVYETMTDENISKQKRAASEKRRVDIQDFSSIINDARDEQALKNATKDRMNKMKVGFFSRSLLKAKMEQAIKQHEQAAKIGASTKSDKKCQLT